MIGPQIDKMGNLPDPREPRHLEPTYIPSKEEVKELLLNYRHLDPQPSHPLVEELKYLMLTMDLIRYRNKGLYPNSLIQNTLNVSIFLGGTPLPTL